MVEKDSEDEYGSPESKYGTLEEDSEDDYGSPGESSEDKYGTLEEDLEEESEDEYESPEEDSIFKKEVRKGSIVLIRMESITEYINKGGQPRSGTQGQSDTPVSANDMCALDEWPSHARRYRAQLQYEADEQKKKKKKG
ncbi:hypothetical protein QYE76_047479 [Lolium multiflorum]|uniref:Uncharacterized protein n=1 Tax=Lolium multiflorum TaxID=4521 RepID=A0AAD8TQG4_LOLMU|nr:hypothetical protein QYE76_047479 [Lolium multiflorum]